MNDRRRRFVACVLAVGLLVPAPAALAAPSRPSGTPDPSFGTRGVQVIDLPGADLPIGMVALPGGRVAVLITSDREPVSVVVLGRDGRPVRSFGRGGVAAIGLGREVDPVGVAADRSGRLYVAATAVSAGTVPDARAVVVRLTASGALDRTYGRNGVATTPIGDATPVDATPVAFALGPAGDVVFAGAVAAGGYYAAAGTAALIRLRPDGWIDDRFGVGGVVPLGNRDLLPAIGGVAVDASGRVVVAEEGFVTAHAVDEVTLRRFARDGKPDLTFGVTGVARVDVPGADRSARVVTHDARGRILVHGATWNRFPFSATNDHEEGWPPFVARLRSDGSMDPSFGRRGAAVVHRDARGRGLLWTGGLAVDGDRVFFTSLFDRPTTLRHAVVALTPTGSLDTRFAPASPELDNVSEIVVGRDRVVVAGTKSWRTGGTVVMAFRR